MKEIPANDQHDEFYISAIQALQNVVNQHRDIPALDVIAVMGIALGFMVAQYPAEFRQEAINSAGLNFHKGIKDFDIGNFINKGRLN